MLPNTCERNDNGKQKCDCFEGHKQERLRSKINKKSKQKKKDKIIHKDQIEKPVIMRNDNGWMVHEMNSF